MSVLLALAAALPIPSAVREATAEAIGVNDIAANAALLFLVGGLAMLALIVVLVILQSMLPDHSPVGEEANGARQLRPVAGSAAGSPGPLPDTLAPAIDKAMDHAVELRLGEPRLLHVQADLARVRIYSCAGCIDRHAGGASSPGCFDQAMALGASFRQTFGGNVQAQEILCRLRGDAECEFEVRH